MKTKEDVFKEYDIRGKWGVEIDKEFVTNFAGAFLEYLNNVILRRTQDVNIFRFHSKNRSLKILISRDKENVSKKAYAILKRELIKNGAEVTDGGEATIPLHNFASGTEKTDGAIMVTASHLPKNYTGFKIAKNGTEPIEPKELKEIMMNEEFLIYNKTGILNKKVDFCLRRNDSMRGKEIKKNYLEKYADFLVKEIKIKKEWRVAIDASGGGTGKILNEVLKKLPKIKAEKICFEKCGHNDNPLEKKNWKEIEKEIDSRLRGNDRKKKQSRDDLGVMFDGDGDRIVFFNEKGKFINPSSILAALIKGIKPKGFVGNVNVGMAVKENADKFIETRTGHIFIKKEMREEGVEMGGEHSGHIYFKRNFYTEDPVFAFLKLLEILEKSGKKLSEAVKEADPYFKTEEKNFKISEENFEKIKEKIKKKFKKEGISEIDGIKISGKNWWFNLRKSGTEDKTRLNVEAKSEEELKKIKKEVNKIIKG
ncbi:MAG: hypothetical protein WC435_02715 [Candidatus Paceibacterota bacterium]